MVQNIKNDFLKKITQPGDNIEISDFEIKGDLEISTDLKPCGISIRKCTFRKNVVFKNIDLNCGIKFIDCTFSKNLLFDNCTASNLNTIGPYATKHIHISNTKINSLIFQNNNSIDKGITINRKSEIRILKVGNLYCDYGGFSIYNSIIQSKFDFYECRFSNDFEVRNKSVVEGVSRLENITAGAIIQIRILKVGNLYCDYGGFSIYNSIIQSKFDFYECRFSNDFEVRNKSVVEGVSRLENITAGAIILTDINFKRDLYIWAGTVGLITFNDGVYEDNIRIQAVKIESNLTVVGTKFKKSLIVDLIDEPSNVKGSLDEVFINSVELGERLVINGFNEEIGLLNILLSKRLSGSVHLNSCKIKETDLSGESYQGDIVFNHCQVNKLSLNNFTNYSTLSFISCSAYNNNSELSIHYSNLGKTHFYNTSFEGFKNISIINSVLIEIITANIIWFKTDLLNNNYIDYSQNREVFRQLKFAMEKQGDRVNYLKFKAAELKSLRGELKSKKINRNISNYLDRFILFMSRSNNYGEHWLKPILIASGLGLIFLLLIVIGISDQLTYRFNFSGESISITWAEYKKYFYALPQLMNPAHVLKRIFPTDLEIGFGAYLFDYLFKILLAFFIYQVVFAFRKFM